jgi:hypothetical protein
MTLPYISIILLGLLLVLVTVKYLFLRQFAAQLLQQQVVPGKERVFSWELSTVQDDVSKVYVGFTIGAPVSLYLEHTDGTSSEIRAMKDQTKE